jgi:dihydrofolate reductase (trimethoprim resistance protein)
MGVKLKVSLIAAKSANGVIGNGPDIPWVAKGEQLLFKALTFNQWLLVGRKTFQSMGVLPNRKYAVLTRSGLKYDDENVLVFSSIQEVMKEMPKHTKHLIVAGGGEIYKNTIGIVDTIHLSTIHKTVEGDVEFPEIPKGFQTVFEQEFKSNINYTYKILQKG